MYIVTWTSHAHKVPVSRRYATEYHAEQFARVLRFNGCAGVLVKVA